MQRPPSTPGVANGRKPEPAAGDTLGGLKMLVVDDQKTMRSIVRQLLSEIGIKNVTEAEDGQQALDFLATADGREVDMIICDLNMPGMDGLKFCDHVRRSETLRARHIPILVLTAEPEGLLIDVVRQVGAAEVAHKPISAPELRGYVERLVGVKSA